MDAAPRNASFSGGKKNRSRFDPPSQIDEFGVVVRDDSGEIRFCGNVAIDGFKDKEFFTRNPIKQVSWYCGPLTFRVDVHGFITRVYLRGMDLGCPAVDFYVRVEEF